MMDPIDWDHGSFHWCIPVEVKMKEKERFRLNLRIPLPYAFPNYPDGADESVRCEAATSVMIQDHCPDVPIPKL